MSEQPNDPQPAADLTPHAPPAEITGTPSAEDLGLPAYEPLTPELVEDESIRGDFVMKWAVALLAFLLASNLIGETTTLVHVKTGQYLAAHGIVPPAKDVFANTATHDERPWTNLSWLFDLLTAGIYSVTSWTGLAIFKALLAALTFGLLLHVCRPRLSTWWGSICAALAVVVCQPRFTVQPELITLLGLSLTLWILHTWQVKLSTGFEKVNNRIWLLVPLFLVWSNLDDRMFFGILLIVLYGLGETLGGVMGLPGSKIGTNRQQFWTVLGVCCLAAMVHPFGWKWLTAPGALYQLTYPGLRSYAPTPPSGPYLVAFSITQPFVLLASIDRTAIAVLLLLLAAGLTLALNWKRLDLGHVLVLVGFTGLAIVSIHEWAATAIVFCAIATLNGQDWFAATFPQTYSIETRALLFSRGGRAATVLVFFLIALLAVTGRWKGASETTLGYGLDPSLASLTNIYEKQLQETFDDRPFNYVLNQGDLLIWAGKHPFIDHRLKLFGERDGTDLIGLHKDVRKALRKRDSKAGTGDSTVWKDAFDKYEVTHVLPRLTFAPAPDYASFGDLLQSPNWDFTSLSAATAVFYRKDRRNPQLAKFVAEHKQDFGKQAFQEDSDPLLPRDEWPKPPSFYEKYVWGKKRPVGPEIDEAFLLYWIAVNSRVPRPEMAYLASRKAQAGLSKNPNDAAGYDILAKTYLLLSMFEGEMLGRQNRGEPFRLRYYQTLMAFNEAITAAPNNSSAHITLFDLYQREQKWDLAKRELDAFDQMLQTVPNPTQQQQEQLDQNFKWQDELQRRLSQIEQDVEKLESQSGNPAQLIGFCYEKGCVLKALQILDENKELMQSDPNLMRLRVILLLEVGRVEEAFTEAGVLEAMSMENGYTEWRMPRALSALAKGEFNTATQTWLQAADIAEKTALIKVLRSLPPNSLVQSPQPWPINEAIGGFEFFYQAPAQIAASLISAALIQVEAGECQKAQESFRKVLDVYPETPDRGLIAYYLYRMTGEETDILPPSQYIPVLFESEADAAETAEPAASPVKTSDP